MTPRPETATCATCCYWSPDGEEKEQGACRRDPPAIFDDGESMWPSTGKDDWCGHHNDDWNNVEEGSSQARKNT